jgi:hypothetical protein
MDGCEIPIKASCILLACLSLCVYSGRVVHRCFDFVQVLSAPVTSVIVRVQLRAV